MICTYIERFNKKKRKKREIIMGGGKGKNDNFAKSM